MVLAVYLLFSVTCFFTVYEHGAGQRSIKEERQRLYTLPPLPAEPQNRAGLAAAGEARLA